MCGGGREVSSHVPIIIVHHCSLPPLPLLPSLPPPLPPSLPPPLPSLPPSLLPSPPSLPPSLPLTRCVVVNSDTTCEICGSRLLVQGFYMFPCHHAFHKHCLIPEVYTHYHTHPLPLTCCRICNGTMFIPAILS